MLCAGSSTRVHVMSHKVSFNTEMGACFNKPRTVVMVVVVGGGGVTG